VGNKAKRIASRATGAAASHLEAPNARYISIFSLSLLSWLSVLLKPTATPDTRKTYRID
jgi:hypothetical protein